MTSKQPQNDAACHFFKIAGELRNRIYREVLLQLEPVGYGSKGYKRPGLLNTYKQIRSEALKIYYYENKFHTDLHAYDATGMHRFRTSMETMGVKYEKIDEMTSIYHGSESWVNLIEWLRLYHAGIIDWRMTCTAEHEEEMEWTWDYDRYRLQEVLIEMFDIVDDEGGGVPWEKVKWVLEDSRRILFALDDFWGDGESGSDEDGPDVEGGPDEDENEEEQKGEEEKEVDEQED